MEFKVGDKVKILDRVGGPKNYSPVYVDEMLKYVGTSTVVKQITEVGSLILDNSPDYYWDKKAVELVNEDKSLHPSELKDGDFIRIENDYSCYIYIFKEYKDKDIYRYVSFNLEMQDLDTNSSIKWGAFNKSDKITYATEEEKKLLLDALEKEGLTWNKSWKRLIPTPETWNTNETKNHRISVDLAEPQELNLFPTKKHYQLNFNY